MHALRCARCRTPLAALRLGKVRGWRCHGCGGSAMGVAVIRQSSQRDRFNDLWGGARSAAPGTLGCPACDNPMRAVRLPDGDRELEVDVCLMCHLVWFDPDERAALGSPAPEPEAPAALPVEAARALATARAEQVRRHYDDKEEIVVDAEVPTWQHAASFFGLPVEVGEPAKSRAPVVTWVLGALMLLGAWVWTSDEAFMTWGVRGDDPTRLAGLPFLTTFFVHAGWIHLVGNLYFLFVFADNVEDELGHGRFLLLVALATVVGALAHVILDPRSSIPLVGASGGISGVLIFYALRFPRARLGFRWWHWLTGFRWIHFGAIWVVGLWLLFQIAGVRGQLQGACSVSALAHVGGAGTGALAFLVWRRID